MITTGLLGSFRGRALGTGTLKASRTARALGWISRSRSRRRGSGSRSDGQRKRHSCRGWSTVVTHSHLGGPAWWRRMGLGHWTTWGNRRGGSCRDCTGAIGRRVRGCNCGKACRAYANIRSDDDSCDGLRHRDRASSSCSRCCNRHAGCDDTSSGTRTSNTRAGARSGASETDRSGVSESDRWSQLGSSTVAGRDVLPWN